jgi:hypothetical protein
MTPLRLAIKLAQMPIGQSGEVPAFFPRAAKRLAGEDVFRSFMVRKTDGGKK